MIDLCLRSDTEDAMLADLHRVAGWLTLDDRETGAPVGWIVAGHGFAFDPIGPAEGDNRFHANLRLWGPRASLASIFTNFPSTEIVTPDSPARVWA